MEDCSKNVSAIIENHKPTLTELKNVIEQGLQSNFQTVHVDIVECPDLCEPPFNQTSSGFGQSLRIAEVGGPGNLFPVINKNKEFDLVKIGEVCELNDGFVFGPGAGPWPIVGTNCEMVADGNLKENKFATKTTRIDKKSRGYILENIKSSKFSLMANLALSDSDIQADVLHFKCEVRTGPENVTNCIRKALAEFYGDKTVSIAGFFIIRQGKAKLHIMPDFPCCPFTKTSEIDKWLRYYDIRAPLVCATVMHSNDPGYNLRLEHTHCFSEQGDGGHYHYDTTPETVIYEGWLAPSEKIYRIDEVAG